MQSITLSETALRVNSLLPSCPKPLKPHCPTFTLICNSKLSFRNPCLIFSRNSRQWCENPIQEAFRHVWPAVSKNLDSLEVRDLDSQNCQATKESMLPEKSSVGSNSLRKHQLLYSTTSYGDLLKFALLFGYLTLQGSQQAFAGTDVAVGLQSTPFLGDLGDISTGIFADIFLRTGRQDLFHSGTFSS